MGIDKPSPEANANNYIGYGFMEAAERCFSEKDREEASQFIELYERIQALPPSKQVEVTQAINNYFFALPPAEAQNLRNANIFHLFNFGSRTEENWKSHPLFTEDEKLERFLMDSVKSMVANFEKEEESFDQSR